MADELPDKIKSLAERCECDRSDFSSADMFIALEYAAQLHGRVSAIKDHYQWIADSTLRDHETMRVAYLRTMKLVASDIRGILDDTKKDCS